MESIVFIDSEITNEGAIADLGAVKETAQFHSVSKHEFSEFVKGCDFVCGHNIIHHDLKYISGLFNEDGTTKKYIKTWSLADREGNDYIGFQYNGTYGWHGSWAYWSTSNSYPVSIKSGLFGVDFGYNNNYASGGPFSNVTFRPVIWN